MLINQALFCFLLLVFAPLYSFDLISGGNGKFAYLEGFSYSAFQIDSFEVITVDGEEKYTSTNETFSKEIYNRVHEELTQNIDSKIYHNTLSMMNIAMTVKFKHGSKFKRMIRFNNGSARVIITLRATDQYDREIFFIEEYSFLKHALFGGKFHNVVKKSLNKAIKTLSFVLATQRKESHKLASSRFQRKQNPYQDEQSNFLISSDFTPTKQKHKEQLKPNKITPKATESIKDSNLTTKEDIDLRSKNIMNIGLGVGGLAFVGGEYKLRISRKLGAFVGLSLFGGSIGGMLYFNEEKYSNYLNIGIDTFMIQKFIGIKFQYGDYFFSSKNRAFSYEVGLYSVLKDNFENNDGFSDENSDIELYPALSIGYAF